MPQRKRTAEEAGLVEPTGAGRGTTGRAAALIVGATGEEVTGSSQEHLLLDELFLQLSGNDGGTVRAPLA